MMKKAQALQTANSGGANFLISIHHQENHSWQGAIQWLDTGKKIHFRSELELLNLIHDAIETAKEQKLRTWEDVQKSNIG